ncbi:hypothetical protein MWU57_08190 [Isoptericola sp. S6320L]|uniref:hypothetical protein n=1 Tax=Isoptericola sp. S6320L TaxID=2926411 RepID=UPI001FF2BE22|nr:hypothetical protein [Isoptericola sp. S6320L]MCK0117014.1 hypothetical protein [Isoptericola sp. S6320L]
MAAAIRRLLVVLMRIAGGADSAHGRGSDLAMPGWEGIRTRLLLRAGVRGIPLVYACDGSREYSMASTELREQIRALLAAGLKQRQIAVSLGIGQATVSDHKRALVAAGRLPASPPVTARGTGGAVVDLVPAEPASRRSRAEVLLEHAELKASTLRTAARTFAEHIVGADEWVTDGVYREQVRAVAADAVGEAIADLERIAIDLGLREPAAGGSSTSRSGSAR